MVKVLNQLFAAFLPLVVFATYIYHGNTINVSTTLLATSMLNRVKKPISSLNKFYSRFLTTQVSVDRLNAFMAVSERQPGFIEDQTADRKTETALLIQGSFCYNLPKKKQKKVKVKCAPELPNKQEEDLAAAVKPKLFPLDELENKTRIVTD